VIVVEQGTVVEAAREALFAVLETSPNTSDESILREASAVIRVTPGGYKPAGFRIQDNVFQYEGNYLDYVPEVDNTLVDEEERDYTKLFLASGAVSAITQALLKDGDSRRCVASSWDEKYLDPQVVGVCITQLYARLRSGRLELHSHARANDAYRLLLLDMQLGLCIQEAMAQAIGVPVGEYIHFVDSLHVYKRYEAQIERQRQYMRSCPLWNA
jgi:hypothetical protein